MSRAMAVAEILCEARAQRTPFIRSVLSLHAARPPPPQAAYKDVGEPFTSFLPKFEMCRQSLEGLVKEAAAALFSQEPFRPARSPVSVLESLCDGLSGDGDGFVRIIGSFVHPATSEVEVQSLCMMGHAAIQGRERLPPRPGGDMPQFQKLIDLVRARGDPQAELLLDAMGDEMDRACAEKKGAPPALTLHA